MILARLFRRPDPRARMSPLYAAVVAMGRRPHWYVEGAVPDSVDGRFDMIAAVLALVLLRLEALGAPREEVWLTELFVDDMDGQLRQIGIGDIVVGKHVGRMMSALGGRIGAYRAALVDGESLDEALVRNLYRGAAPADAALAHVAAGLRALWAGLADASLDTLRAGTLPG